MNRSSPLLDLPVHPEPIPAAVLVLLGAVAGVAVLLSGLPVAAAGGIAAGCPLLAAWQARRMLMQPARALQRVGDGSLLLVDGCGQARPARLRAHAALGPWCLLSLERERPVHLLLSRHGLGERRWRELRRWLQLDAASPQTER